MASSPPFMLNPVEQERVDRPASREQRGKGWWGKSENVNPDGQLLIMLATNRINRWKGDDDSFASRLLGLIQRRAIKSC